MSGLKQLRSQIDRLKGRQDQLLASVSQIEEEQVDSERLVIRLEKASVIIQEVAKATQKELKYHISELVTLALKIGFIRN